MGIEARLGLLVVLAATACAESGSDGPGSSTGGAGGEDGWGGSVGAGGMAQSGASSTTSGTGGQGGTPCAEASCDASCGGPGQPCCSYATVCDVPTLGCDAGTCTSCIAAIDTGSEHACALRTDGTLWCWGYNAYDQLGFTGLDKQPTPTKITSAPPNVTALHLANYKTCVRAADGKLSCWGYYDELTDPLEGPFGATVAEPAIGLNHTCARTTSGQAWCWGDGDLGQIGNGVLTSAPDPTLVTSLGSDVAAIDSSDDTNCVRKTDGSAWCWGSNVDGVLGIGSTDNQASPVQVSALGNEVAEISVTAYSGCARKTDGSVWCWGDLPPADSPYTTPKAITGLSSGVSHLAVGRFHACAVKEADGSVWCWGYNDLDQLGVAQLLKSATPVELTAVGKGVVQIATEFWFTCALKDDGSVWCWGYNGSGELGQGHTNQVIGTVEVALACPDQ